MIIFFTSHYYFTSLLHFITSLHFNTSLCYFTLLLHFVTSLYYFTLLFSLHYFTSLLHFDPCVSAALFVFAMEGRLDDEAVDDVTTASICAFHVAERHIAIVHYDVFTISTKAIPQRHRNSPMPSGLTSLTVPRMRMSIQSRR